jgi:hypothetical protein
VGGGGAGSALLPKLWKVICEVAHPGAARGTNFLDPDRGCWEGMPRGRVPGSHPVPGLVHALALRSPGPAALRPRRSPAPRSCALTPSAGAGLEPRSRASCAAWWAAGKAHCKCRLGQARSPANSYSACTALGTERGRRGGGGGRAESRGGDDRRRNKGSAGGGGLIVRSPQSN